MATSVQSVGVPVAAVVDRRDCCSEVPIDRLLAVTFDCVTDLVCSSCASDCVSTAVAAGGRVEVEPFIAWVWSS